MSQKSREMERRARLEAQRQQQEQEKERARPSPERMARTLSLVTLAAILAPPRGLR